MYQSQVQSSTQNENLTSVSAKPPLSVSYSDINALASASTLSLHSSKGGKVREDQLRSASFASQGRQTPSQLTRYSSPDDVLKRFSNKWNKDRSGTGSGQHSGSETPMMEEKRADTMLYESNGSLNAYETETGKNDGGSVIPSNKSELHHLRNVNTDLQYRLRKSEDALSEKTSEFHSMLSQHEEMLTKLTAENDHLKKQQATDEKLIEELQTKVKELEYLFYKNHAMGILPPMMESQPQVNTPPPRYDHVISKLEEKVNSQESEISWLKRALNDASSLKEEQELREGRRPLDNVTDPMTHSTFQNYLSDFDDASPPFDKSHGEKESHWRFEPPPVHPMIAKMTMKRKRNAALYNSLESPPGQHSMSNGDENPTYSDFMSHEDPPKPTAARQSTNNKNKYSVYVFGRRVETSSHQTEPRSPTSSLYPPTKSPIDRGLKDAVEEEDDEEEGDSFLGARAGYHRSSSPLRELTNGQRAKIFSLRQRPSSAGSGNNENNISGYRSSSLNRRVEWADEKSSPENKTTSETEWTPEREAELKSRVDKLLQRAHFNIPKQHSEPVKSQTNHLSMNSSSQTLSNPWRKDSVENKRGDTSQQSKPCHSPGYGTLSSFNNENQDNHRNMSTLQHQATDQRYGRHSGNYKTNKPEISKDNDASNEARRFADQLIAKYVGNGVH